MMEIAYRFAGFGDESCDCLAALPAADVDGLRRLHLVADRRERHATIELTAPDLTEGATAVSARA
jgi:methoxymalonate biosynthesis protein